MLGLGVFIGIAKKAYTQFDSLFGALKARSTYYENDGKSRSEVSRISSSGILDKASILLTPTATSDARVHSVKTYTGDEEVTDGDFPNLDNWSVNGGDYATIVDGALNSNNTENGNWHTENISQNISFVNGKTYKVTFKAKNISGGVNLRLTQNGYVIFTDNITSSFVDYEVYYTANADNGSIRIFCNDAVGEFQIDNLSVVDVSSDFDFDRASSATRINSDGLVQDMQSITDPELVLNGDFEELGDDLVTNGDFSSGSTSWSTIGSGITITDRANFNIVDNESLVQEGVLTNGKTYKVVFDILSVDNGSISVWTSINGYIQTSTTIGTKEVYFTYDGTDGQIRFRGTFGTGFQGSIDNISVQQVDTNDRWSLTGGWSIADNKLSCDGTNDSLAYQSLSSLNLGDTLKVTYTITDYTSGTLRIGTGAALQQPSGIARTSSGTYVEYITKTDGLSAFGFRSYSFNGSIDNVSVKDITFSTDVDLARINYDSNGDNGHWLLEPTSTNLITYSEDFDEWASSNATLESGYAAPDGSTNAYKVTGTVGSSTVYFAGVPNLSSTSTRTIWARTVSGTGTINLCSYGDNSNNNFTITEEWQRFEVNGTTTSTGESNFYATDFRFQQPNALTEIIIWGAQAENLSYATSYIPTHGSTVTRATETLNGSGNSTLINSTEGVLYAEIAALADDQSYRYITLSDGTNSNYVIIRYYNIANKISAFIENTSGVQGSTSHSFSPSETITDFHKVAFKWKANDFALYIDGTEVSTQSSGTTFSANALNKLQFNEGDGSGNDFYGKCKALAVFNEALSDTELENLTS